MPSKIEVTQTEWSGPPEELVDGTCGYTRKLAALTTIESDGGEACYSFSGVLRYSVGPDDRALEISTYDIRGVRIDGLDFGVIEYSNREPLRVDVGDDRRFTIRANVCWRDRQNPDGTLALVMRGNLLENHAIAYLSSTISGNLEVGGTGNLHMTTPAQW
ncbi:hypothetical protein [Enhygromyxa salina]|uniref:Uncharacterized protein n=1 Tax=Enhygromyxa salina TaxID=215803 RepID=A0A2S9Y5W4_9BACT|nr:hypothetical protein [Enhygromyxa salina]PRQ00484.1 hypothetical protein ENSA7_59780 [Enhygromyxa salina]